MTNEEIQALQALSELATKGPWRRVAQGGHSTVLANVPVPSNDLRTAPFGYSSEMGYCLSHAFIDDSNCVRMDFTCFSHANAAFIAAAREAIPTLCADLLTARAELTAIANAVDVPLPDGIDLTIVNAVKELHARVDEFHRQACVARAELAEARQIIHEFCDAHGLNGWDNVALCLALCRAQTALEGEK